MGVSKIAQAMRERISADKRATCPVKVYLDPDAPARLAQLRAEAAQLRQAAAVSNAVVKMGGRLADLDNLIEEAEAALGDVTAQVVLQTLTSVELKEATTTAGIGDDSPLAELWKATIKAAFHHVEDLDGTLVEDVTAEDWAGLVDVMAHTEVKSAYDRLQVAAQGLIPS